MSASNGGVPSSKPIQQTNQAFERTNAAGQLRPPVHDPLEYPARPPRRRQQRQTLQPDIPHVNPPGHRPARPPPAPNPQQNLAVRPKHARPEPNAPGPGEQSWHGRTRRPQHPPVVNPGPSSYPYSAPRQWMYSPAPHHGRPPPTQHRQLYDPQQDLSSSNQPPWMNRHAPDSYTASQAAAQAQSAYLDAIAGLEVPKAMISAAEEHQKETMRQDLEDVCQRVVTEYEIEKDALFDGSTVSLKCYGSLRTGFATHSSDMDLVLTSPNSNPHLSSTESDIPRLLEKALLELGFGARLLTRTRMPLIKFCEKPAPELAARLQEERIKWENQKAVPSKEPAKETVDEARKVSNVPEPTDQKAPPIDRAGALKDDTPEGEVPLVADELKDIDETFSLPMLQLPERVNEPQSSQNPGCGTREVGSMALIDKESSQANDKTEEPEAAISAPGRPRPNKDSADVYKKKPVAPSIVKERREAVLANNELVRLYKLAMKEGWFEPGERTTILAFCRAVEDGSPDDQVAERRAQLLSLPDVLNRYRPPPDHFLDYPKDGVGVQCDIIFSNPLAVHNSAMLRCYNLSDPRVKPMVLFVKAWAKRRKINSPYHGTLSSYGYVLMVLHYLINVAKPAICLNLQHIEMAMRDTSAENTQIIEGYNVRFWRDEAMIRQWAMQGHITPDRQSTVGSLLRGFFQYFAAPSGGFSWAMEVLSLRTPGGILTKQQKQWIAAKTEVLDPVRAGEKGQEVRQRYLFAIEDPFETNHNIARTVVHNGIVAIRDEFRRANRLIQQAANSNVTEDFFAEAAAKDDLNYRYFGPRPRPNVPKAPVQATKAA
ncbi:MAG: hypothetical protein L6R35_003169 [Caloplaca aegaea]|nr:MAG: hypothetical protein L6R35_003169 [Caloplaca aegaea]